MKARRTLSDICGLVMLMSRCVQLFGVIVVE